MTTYLDALPRVLAKAQGRALPVRQTSALSADPDVVFGIAPIRVVSEQQFQAVAYGLIDAPPQVVVTWNPLGREAGYLEPFGRALDLYLSSMVAADQLARIWLPHQAAAEVLDVLGHRFQNNKKATPLLRRMGALCRALTEEAAFPGQQLVAVAGSLLAAHVATGQSPLEDHHLGALMAWVQPLPGADPAEEAERRALVPAAAMLERSEDDRVETLRKLAKQRNPAAAAARVRIEAILVAAARREWDLLVQARGAFWALGLPPAPGLGTLVNQSRYRIGVAVGPNPYRRSLARLLEDYEYALDLAEDADVRGDRRIRERARIDGRALLARVIRVDQPRPNYHSCTLFLETDQEVLRIRPGTTLKTVDGAVSGRVERVMELPAGPGKGIELRVKTGVQAGRRPTPGATLDLVDTDPFNAPMMKRRTYDAMWAARPALVYGDTLPPAIPRTMPAGSLAAAADALRRP